MATKKTAKKIATTSTEEQGAQGATTSTEPKARPSRPKRAQAAQEPAAEPLAKPAAEPAQEATEGATEAAEAAEGAPVAKGRRGRRKDVDQSDLAPDDPQAIHERTVANLPAPPDMRPANVTSATLLDASAGFIAAIEAEGASEATVSGYRRELKIVLEHFGEDVLLCSLTPRKVQNYFESDAVMIARDGAPKAEPSWQRTRRVLRLALVWAVEKGMLEAAPLPANPKRAAKAQQAEPNATAS